MIKKSANELVDAQWYKRAFCFEINIEEANISNFLGTDDVDESFSPVGAGQTKVYESQELWLTGKIQMFRAPDGFHTTAPDFVNSRLSMRVDVTELRRGPEGLFDYGFLGLAEVGGKILQTSSLLRMSEAQFQGFTGRLPIYLQALAGSGFVWNLNVEALTYEPCPQIDENGGRIWKFWCKKLQFCLKTRW